jgi:hypothetical protein
MEKTLVVILGDIREHELTYNNFKSNVIDELNADLCLCLAIKEDYDYNNPYHKLSKYNFLYNEPDDFGEAFDYAYENMSKPSVEINWRDFLKNTSILFGGVKYNDEIIKGGGGIVLFLRWFLLKNLTENNLIDKYDRFVVTRSDYMYQLPHPKLNYLAGNYIWFPDSEHCGGYTDRHVVLSKTNVETYLNIFNSMVCNYCNIINSQVNSIEKLIKLHLKEQNVLDDVREFPYVMYLVRSEHGKTRWAHGNYSRELGYYIKYFPEYDRSSYYKNKHLNSGLPIDDFYKHVLNIKKKCIIITTINKPSSQVLSYTNQHGWNLIIVGDTKTDDSLYKNLNCVYLGLDEQMSHFPTFFDKIPLNSYTRKMFGYLYAIKKKYDIIYDTDDDNKYMYDLDLFDNNILHFIGKNIPGNDTYRCYLDYDTKQFEHRMIVHNADAYTYDMQNKLLYLKDRQVEHLYDENCISGTKRGIRYSSTNGFVNIYKVFTDKNIWPRGIPPGHQSIDITPSLTETPTNMDVCVIQGLVNNDPDVDAHYRLNINNEPFNFEKDPGYDIVLDKYSVCPFNTQNTFWTDKTMFYAMYLPVSVTFRYTDILRGFVALYQFWKNNKTIKFTFPTAIQDRNEHDLSKDYESEVPMYETAEKVIELLNENKDATLKDIYNILWKNNIVSETELDTLTEWSRLVEQYEL